MPRELVQIKAVTSEESELNISPLEKKKKKKKSLKVLLIGLINQHRAKVAHDLSLKASVTRSLLFTWTTCHVWEKNMTNVQYSLVLPLMSSDGYIGR